MAESFSLEQLVEKANQLAQSGKRQILAVAGAPGSGKTTITRAIMAGLPVGSVVIAPMDGFHLSNATLINYDRRDRKGAWDTFDADGYINLLTRLKNQTEAVIHAPDFDRDIDESIGSAIPIDIHTPLILAEGTFLFSQYGSWPKLSPLLDQGWFVHLDSKARQERLITRHMKHGMSLQQATDWALGTDENNAKAVENDYLRADLSIKIID
jgi:pantothenate kinase